MKPKLIAAASVLSILGLGIFAVVQMNRTHSTLSVIAVVLALIPMYFLYAVVVLGKFKAKKIYKDSRMKSAMDKRRKYKEFYANNNVANDNGKVLEFPKDKQKEKNNENK